MSDKKKRLMNTANIKPFLLNSSDFLHGFRRMVSIERIPFNALFEKFIFRAERIFLEVSDCCLFTCDSSIKIERVVDTCEFEF